MTVWLSEIMDNEWIIYKWDAKKWENLDSLAYWKAQKFALKFWENSVHIWELCSFLNFLVLFDIVFVI
jgi:hypothetical protein